MTVDKVYDDIKDGIKALADTLGPLAGQLVESAIRAQIAEGVIKILFAVGILLSFIYVFRWLKRETEKIEKDDIELQQSAFIMWSIVLIIYAIGLFPLSYALLRDGIVQAIAPEYSAVKELIKKDK